MSAQQWYMAIGGHQVGPVTQDEIIANLRNGSVDAETLVFTSGMTTWQKVKSVPSFARFVSSGASADPVPPPAPAQPRGRGLAQAQRGARRRIDLVLVVHLDHLDVEAGAKRPRSLLHEREQHRHHQHFRRSWLQDVPRLRQQPRHLRRHLHPDRIKRHR